MTLSGEQWLAQVFRPAVAAVEGVRSTDVVSAGALRALGGRLAAQVEALGDTGVLTDEQERTALDALEEAGIMPEVQSVSASSSSTGVAETPTLRGVLAGPRRLGQLDGRPVTLVSAELWNDRFLVDLYTDPGPEYRDRRTRATREQLEWLKLQRRGQAGEHPGTPRVASPLENLTWQLDDDHGTEYHRTGVSTESGPHLNRQRMRWSPAPPANSDRLTLRAIDATGSVVLNAELRVPGPTT